MIRQLKDIINMGDILGNDSTCITSHFSELSPEDYNTYLIDILDNSDLLSIDYLGNRLDKILSPLYNRLIEHLLEEGENITEATVHANEYLIRVIENKYLYNWNRLAEAMFKDYNPINNYDMVETRNINEKTDKSIITEESNEFNESGNKSINIKEDNNTNTSTEREETTNDKEQQKYAGFNTDTPKIVTETDKDGNVTESNSGESSESKETNNTESEERSGNNSSLSSSETVGELQDNKRDEELRRSGNIGVTTSQQMIQSEIELRKHNLENIIFKDMDEVLFLDYYL